MEIIYNAAKNQQYGIQALSVLGDTWAPQPSCGQGLGTRCPDLDIDLDWHDVWSNIPEVSCNPDHQQIHYNFIHRTYLTPVKMHHMKVSTRPLCTFCPLKAQGTYLQMFWECSPVCQFWNNIACKLPA